MSDEPLGSRSPAEHHLRLHHIGFVVASIQESGHSFALALGARGMKT
jgi:hypothetical protein